MSSCLGGGGRAIRLDLEIIKSPTTSWTSNSSSPSSTLSESSNSTLAISRRKPRTPRKRPNQTYNEAAALLSTAYPKIFSAKHLTKPPCKFTKQTPYPFSYESSDLLLPFRGTDDSSFLIQHRHHHPPVPNHPTEQKVVGCLDKPCLSPGEINSNSNCKGGDFLEFPDNFDAESILDEEVEEGIDSILGNSCEHLVEAERNNNDGGIWHTPTSQMAQLGTCYGYPVGLGFGINFDYSFGMRNTNIIRAFRNAGEGDWWRFPCVNVLDITPKFHKSPAEKKKKKKKVEKLVELKNISEPPPSPLLAKENPSIPSSSQAINKERTSCTLELSHEAPPPIEPKANAGLLLKLNYDGVLNDWSDGPSPFSDDSPAVAEAKSDVQARLAKIDLFSESGVREASVLRYKEKRSTRLFSKKIRYQVRKVNADRLAQNEGPVCEEAQILQTVNKDRA